MLCVFLHKSDSGIMHQVISLLVIRVRRNFDRVTLINVFYPVLYAFFTCVSSNLIACSSCVKTTTTIRLLLVY